MVARKLLTASAVGLSVGLLAQNATGAETLVVFLTVDCYLQWPQLEDMAWGLAHGRDPIAPTVFFLTTWDEDPFDPSRFMTSFDAEALLTVEWADYLRSVPGADVEPNPTAAFQRTFMMRTPGADFPHDYRVDDAGKVVALRAYWELDRLRFG